MDGDDRLRNVTIRENTSGQLEATDIAHVFVMIGASPNTGWLRNTLAMDDKGFIITGSAASSTAFFGTNLDGVYAVGDVRCGSVKRVASAVGEGSVVVSDIHKFLASNPVPQAKVVVSTIPAILQRHAQSHSAMAL
jgi:thioredoxin reductase (NADPH)